MAKVLIGACRAVSTTIGAEEYYLLYNGFALIKLKEMIGDHFFTVLSQMNEETIPQAALAISILMEQGENARRANGLERREILTPEQLTYAIGQVHLVDALESIRYGTERDVETDSEEEVDLILLEQNKKKERV